MLKIIKKQSKLVLLLSFILLVGLSLSGCDSGSTGNQLSETYNAEVVIEGVTDEEHAELFSVSADGESGIDQFNYEENTLTGSITDLKGSVELTLIINNDDLDNGMYSVNDNTLEVDSDNNEAEYKVEFSQEENNEEITGSWTVEVEEEDLKEENVEVEIEEKIKLTIPSDNFNENFKVTVNQYDVKTLSGVDKLHDVQEAYSIYIDDMGISSQSQSNTLSSPLMVEIYNQDSFNKDEIMFMNYIDNQWRILGRSVTFNRESFSLETDNLKDLEKLIFTYIDVKHGSITNTKLEETVTEEGNIKQEVHIEDIDGVIGNLGEAPWYRMSFYGKNNVIDLKSPGDHLFNHLGFKYIPPGESKDLEFEYYGVGGKIDMRLLSSGVEVLPIFYADLLYMTLNNGDSLPFPITNDMLKDEDIEVAVDFLEYIEDEIDEIRMDFDSLHNNTRKLINWGKDKILEYAEDELTGEIKDRVKNAMGYWWTLIHTTNRSVSSVIFTVAGEDAQVIEFGSFTFPEIELEPANIELSPGDSQKFTARAYPRGYKDITLTGPEWDWYIREDLGYVFKDEDEIKINLYDFGLEGGSYIIEASIQTFIDGEIKRVSEEANIIVDENQVDYQFDLELNVQGEGQVLIDNDEDGESWNIDDGIVIEEIEEDTELRLTTNPTDGWEFSHWEGDVADTDSADTTVTMDDDKTVTVNFVEEDDGDEIVEFEDPNLEEAVREKINKPEGTLYVSDVINITELDASERGIESVEGIQYLENLKVLDFDFNEVSDINPLENLTELGSLNFGHNEVSDINPLENLTELGSLGFYGNEVSDISILANLTKLEGLNFQVNEVSDIDPLENLTKLKYLAFSGNDISDINPLENLAKLESLDFGQNEVSDINPLENLAKLESLDFRSNEVSDISILANLTEVKYLLFSRNDVSDINALENLTELRRLWFNSNEVEDITPLVENEGLGDGDYIYMQENYLDLTPGSEDMENINTLIDRGVDVEYEPQKEAEETEYTLTVQTKGQGSTEPAEGYHTYNEGDPVNISADPEAGWEFSHWEGEVDDPYSAETTIEMNNNEIVKAVFVEEAAEIPSPPVLIEPGSDTDPGPVIETLAPTLTWEEVEEAEFYNLAISEEGISEEPYGPENVIYEKLGAYGDSHQVPEEALEQDTKYRWQMTAENEEGRSDYSGYLYFQTYINGEPEPVEPGEMVLVEAGTSSNYRITGPYLDRTLRDIEVENNFYIGKYHVTQAEFEEVMGFNPSRFNDNDHPNLTGNSGSRPVERVTWYDAVKYANELSEIEGLDKYYNLSDIEYDGDNIDSATVTENIGVNGYRLPTEDEHEYAMRGGSNGNSTTYAGSNDLDEVGWYSVNSDAANSERNDNRGTMPVGEKEANELGLYDMSGNVSDWTNTASGSGRVRRGGSWLGAARNCWVSESFAVNSFSTSSTVGFRLSRRP